MMYILDHCATTAAPDILFIVPAPPSQVQPSALQLWKRPVGRFFWHILGELFQGGKEFPKKSKSSKTFTFLQKDRKKFLSLDDGVICRKSFSRRHEESPNEKTTNLKGLFEKT